MKVTTKAGSADFLTFVVDKEEVTITDKAIQLPVRRTNGSVLVAREWFPLSQYGTVRISVPFQLTFRDGYLTRRSDLVVLLNK